ncbi:hypothetical protein A3C98_05640 [Candidatus Roizmanbacteria bacterium RIFCSPHIGHO2_02_FULL_37_15]|uniref:Large ribosomal subunit protein bL25 n=1 Tax=Candidatus Roizmanbacteria bacterium RIFCSPLOWO2_01_FULL_37_16 TaxID=1802058 RepID=A0A1F7IPS5_9BACT|nr:MAG: hypothetical protein A2859_03580 [Candidatus Roizmanbacteria bacterium RIFCSPHIGHO2_01_FULL_37_16b]OGK21494.1 MAG: hypothetical protein A3C98_05640 [Candidatus Roizmanbacteria bacterium RIFCSPHIGHO2_02_FULL_37_15]OGK34134.1 MAG: hypothetical protein A3F57_00605 [Candidatus Roizmanbacteria bacterium RIFCSPHIGHO2_12_FULL_36_11]OGK45364.1 MAG: hypothetical protein A3B40_03380 [Candidatus Roizmanbacteria bacterium RIFCSPLOWO2_01_FULL_37_16]OGK57662.1 MAG: hypothetical protein A3I50_03945 [C
MTKTKKTQQNGQDKLSLNVTPRTTFGKKLKKVRKEGLIPANIYGRDFKSQAVSVSFKEFIKIYKEAKETGVVYVKVNGQELPSLIKNVQRHPVNDQILHTDFRKIDLKQKIQTDVPVNVIGQSEAVTQKGGVLLTQTVTLLVEALPTNIPKQIEVDITSLKEIGQEIKVSDLSKSNKYEFKDPSDKIIVSVVEHKEEEVLPQTAPVAAPEIITAKPEEGVEEEKKPTEPITKTPEAKSESAASEVKKPEQSQKK